MVYIYLVKFMVSGRGERCTNPTLVFTCLPIYYQTFCTMKMNFFIKNFGIAATEC